jgi:hypothetical protein
MPRVRAREEGMEAPHLGEPRLFDYGGARIGVAGMT